MKKLVPLGLALLLGCSSPQIIDKKNKGTEIKIARKLEVYDFKEEHPDFFNPFTYGYELPRINKLKEIIGKLKEEEFKIRYEAYCNLEKIAKGILFNEGQYAYNFFIDILRRWESDDLETIISLRTLSNRLNRERDETIFKSYFKLDDFIDQSGFVHANSFLDFIEVNLIDKLFDYVTENRYEHYDELPSIERENIENIFDKEENLINFILRNPVDNGVYIYLFSPQWQTEENPLGHLEIIDNKKFSARIDLLNRITQLESEIFVQRDEKGRRFKAYIDESEKRSMYLSVELDDNGQDDSVNRFEVFGKFQDRTYRLEILPFDQFKYKVMERFFSDGNLLIKNEGIIAYMPPTIEERWIRILDFIDLYLAKETKLARPLITPPVRGEDNKRFNHYPMQKSENSNNIN